MRDLLKLFALLNDHDFYVIFCEECLSWTQQCQGVGNLEPVKETFAREEELQPGVFKKELHSYLHLDICRSPKLSLDWTQADWIMDGRTRLRELLEAREFNEDTIQKAFMLWIILCNGAQDFLKGDKSNFISNNSVVNVVVPTPAAS